MEKYRLLIVLFAVFVFSASGQDPSPSSASPTQLWKSTWVDILKKDLLTNYDKYARPSQQYNATNLDIKMTLIHVDIDEVKSVMTVFGWMKMEWNDGKLIWNPADYGGVKEVRVGPHEVWRPDIVLYNNAAGASINHYGETNMIIYNSGTVLWVPPAEFKAICQLNMKLWPFDTQFCNVVFGSWTYDGYKMNLTSKEAIETKFIADNHEWKIKNITTQRNVRTYECCVEPYIDITYNFTLVRRSPMFKSVVVSPATVIILMTLANFWLPPTSGEKIVLNGVIALIICMFLMYFAQQLPVMAGSIPLIVLFYSSSLYLIAFSTIISIIVMNLAKSQHARVIPRFLKSILGGVIGTILGLKEFNSEPSRQNKVEGDGNSSSDNLNVSSNTPAQHDWYSLAVAVDRVAFLVYCIIFIILAGSYSI